MICLRSTTSCPRPVLIRPVSRSPNALAVLLSMRPLTSTIVISPACCSAMSIACPLQQLFCDSDHVMPSRPHVCYVIHQCLDEMDAEAADLSRLQGPAGRRRGGLLHLGNRVVDRETGFVSGTGRLHLHNAS